MDATEKLVEDILSDQIDLSQLDLLQMEAVIDFMRDQIEELSASAETDDEEQYASALLVLIDLIQDAAERRFEAESSGDWGAAIESSIQRGNSYFELENYVIQ